MREFPFSAGRICGKINAETFAPLEEGLQAAGQRRRGSVKRGRPWLAAVLMGALLTAAPVIAEAWENPFVDVPAGAWYYDAVEYVATQGLFSGTGEDTFSPHSPMTRAMFVTVLGKFAQVDASAYQSPVFQDVAPEAYYGPYVAWAAETGLVSGVGGGRLCPP